MSHADQHNLHSRSIDISLWRRDINTFSVETQAELTQVMDGLSDAFSRVQSLKTVQSLGPASWDSESDGEETKHVRS